jgi:hypothetical protein
MQHQGQWTYSVVMYQYGSASRSKDGQRVGRDSPSPVMGDRPLSWKRAMRIGCERRGCGDVTGEEGVCKRGRCMVASYQSLKDRDWIGE